MMLYLALPDAVLCEVNNTTELSLSGEKGRQVLEAFDCLVTLVTNFLLINQYSYSSCFIVTVPSQCNLFYHHFVSITLSSKTVHGSSQN
jgi:hypothetical protein